LFWQQVKNHEFQGHDNSYANNPEHQPRKQREVIVLTEDEGAGHTHATANTRRPIITGRKSIGGFAEGSFWLLRGRLVNANAAAKTLEEMVASKRFHHGTLLIPTN